MSSASLAYRNENLGSKGRGLSSGLNPEITLRISVFTATLSQTPFFRRVRAWNRPRTLRNPGLSSIRISNVRPIGSASIPL